MGLLGITVNEPNSNACKNITSFTACNVYKYCILYLSKYIQMLPPLFSKNHQEGCTWSDLCTISRGMHKFLRDMFSFCSLPFIVLANYTVAAPQGGIWCPFHSESSQICMAKMVYYKVINCWFFVCESFFLLLFFQKRPPFVAQLLIRSTKIFHSLLTLHKIFHCNNSLARWSSWLSTILPSQAI